MTISVRLGLKYTFVSNLWEKPRIGAELAGLPLEQFELRFVVDVCGMGFTLVVVGLVVVEIL